MNIQSCLLNFEGGQFSVSLSTFCWLALTNMFGIFSSGVESFRNSLSKRDVDAMIAVADVCMGEKVCVCSALFHVFDVGRIYRKFTV